MSDLSNTQVSLGFFGRDLDPNDITRLLGSAPTSSRVRGQPWTPKHPERKSRFGSWILESTLDSSSTLEQHIDAILAQITDDPVVWADLNQRFKSRVFCGIFMDGWNEGFALTPELLSRLASRGLSLEFDIYAPVDSWSDQAE